MTESAVHPFRAEVAEVLRLVVTSLYSHKEIFLRELISNSSDALDKLRFRSLSEPDLVRDGSELVVRVSANREAKTLTISDNGIGMSAEELAENLGTIARSGTRQFLQKLEDAKKARAEGLSLIGQFGVGFYSAFLVADRVEVVSRAAGTETAHRWVSEAKETFTLSPAERDTAGTTIVLYLKDEEREFLEPYRLRDLIQRYSDFIGYPIEIDNNDDGKKEPDWERVNRASALWQRAPKDVTEEQYVEFYKHLSHDWEEPIARRHFRVEGTQEFTGLLFLPKRPPLDLFDPQVSHGVRLHVKRVFVMENCEELLPKWLRFVRGVVDSEDLPLNVSRETLQDSRAVRTIKKQVVNHSLQMLEELAAERAGDYETFWKAFGAVLKEGLHFEPEHKDRIAKLLRYESTSGDSLVSLDDYVDRMPEGQSAIYYATGMSKSVLSASPHLESLRAHGYEVLLLTDPVDPFAVSALGTYREKPLVSATSAELKLEGPEKKDEKPEPTSDALLRRMREVLGERVDDVRVSDRLTESPVCLVTPERGLEPHIERMLRAQRVDVPKSKRIFEVNLKHAVIEKLQGLHQANPGSARVEDWVELLYDQALIAEGSPIEDPARFARRVTELLAQVPA